MKTIRLVLDPKSKYQAWQAAAQIINAAKNPGLFIDGKRFGTILSVRVDGGDLAFKVVRVNGARHEEVVKYCLKSTTPPDRFDSRIIFGVEFVGGFRIQP